MKGLSNRHKLLGLLGSDWIHSEAALEASRIACLKRAVHWAALTCFMYNSRADNFWPNVGVEANVFLAI